MHDVGERPQVTSDALALARHLTPLGDLLDCRLFLFEMVSLYLAWLILCVLSDFLFMKTLSELSD